MARFRVAVIGSTGRGDYGHGLDAVWKQFEDCEVVGVADPVEAGRKQAQERTGAQTAWADYREMLQKLRPQVVAVCPRWVDQHRDMVLACAEYGCHMYLEKPLCRTLGEADEMLRACEMRHLKVAVAHISRWSPQLEIVKRLIQDGRIGDLLEIRARGKEDARGGGEDLWVLGTHVLDLMRTIAGDPESCFARLTLNGQPVRREQLREGNEGLGLLGGDRVEAMYSFRGGVTGYFSSRKNAGGSPSRFGLRIHGSKGVIEITSGFAAPAWLLEDPHWSGRTNTAPWKPISSLGVDQPEPITATGYEGGNPATARDLLNCIDTDRQPRCSLQEARGAIELVLAAFDSHVRGGPVSLPLQSSDNPLGRL
jgi:predicted dehydrogenase